MNEQEKKELNDAIQALKEHFNGTGETEIKKNDVSPEMKLFIAQRNNREQSVSENVSNNPSVSDEMKEFINQRKNIQK